MKTGKCVFAVVAVLGAVGCAATGAPGEGDPPQADDATLSEHQLISNTNANGTWTADANFVIEQTACKPSMAWEGTASANFTGPAGKTRLMGVCGLREGATSAGLAKACSTVSDCADAPSTLPTGGSRYCTAPNGVGQKYCYYRPGAATTYCAGSPALGATPVAPGYYEQGFRVGGATRWIGYACFEGCSASDPSSSSQVHGTVENTWC